MGSARMLVTAVLVLTAWPAREGVASPPPLVRYEGGCLSVNIERVPLDEVIAAVQRTTGIVFHGNLRDWRRVSKRFDAVPVPRALARLIGKQNFVIRYGRNGRPSRVDLLDAPRAPAIHRGPKPEQQFLAAFTRHPPVPVDGMISQTLGTPNATLTQIAGLLRRPDERVRVEAARALVHAIEDDRGLREGLHAVDDGGLTRVVRLWAGDHAAEFVTTVTASARDPLLRAKISDISGSPAASGTGSSVPPSRGRVLEVPAPQQLVGARAPTPRISVVAVARP